MIGFAAVLAVVAGILFGVGPAYRASRLDPARTLRGQSRGASSAGREAIRTRGWLVTAQVALTLVLLVAAGLFTKSLANLGRVDLGIKPDNVLAFSLAPESNGYTPGADGAARAAPDRDARRRRRASARSRPPRSPR